MLYIVLSAFIVQIKTGKITKLEVVVCHFFYSFILSFKQRPLEQIWQMLRSTEAECCTIGVIFCISSALHVSIIKNRRNGKTSWEEHHLPL